MAKSELPGCVALALDLLVACTFVLAIASAWMFYGCTPQSKPPCTQESLNALRALYVRAAHDLIERGECDKYTNVSDCPPYSLLENHFGVVASAMCSGGGK